MNNKKEEYLIDNLQLMEDILSDNHTFWINVENENKQINQIKKIVKGKKQKTNNILDEELREKKGCS